MFTPIPLDRFVSLPILIQRSGIQRAHVVARRYFRRADGADHSVSASNACFVKWTVHALRGESRER